MRSFIFALTGAAVYVAAMAAMSGALKVESRHSPRCVANSAAATFTDCDTSPDVYVDPLSLYRPVGPKSW